MERGDDDEQKVEAARYALLRRLAYAMRHHVVVHLQPIGMITEVMERRLQAPSPDLAQVHEGMGKVKSHAKAAVQASLDVVAWLAPEEGQVIALDEGVRECVEMLRSYLNFRGFALHSQAESLPRAVSRPALRGTLSAALLALTDPAASPAQVEITATSSERDVALRVQLRPGEGSAGFGGEPHYRVIGWDDVHAIAQAEGVGLLREGDAVTLTLPA